MRVGGRGPDNPNTPRAKRNVFTTFELLMSSNYKNRRRYLSLDNAYLKKCLFANNATTAVWRIRNRRRISGTRGRRHDQLYNKSFTDCCLGDLADTSKTTRILVVTLSFLRTALCG